MSLLCYYLIYFMKGEGMYFGFGYLKFKNFELLIFILFYKDKLRDYRISL